MEIPDSVGNLKNHVSCKVLAEVCQLDDLMEELAALQDCNASLMVKTQREDYCLRSRIRK